MDMIERTTASCESIARREDRSRYSIEDVMALVVECGAALGSNEHFIATILFTMRAERQMFMTLRTPRDVFGLDYNFNLFGTSVMLNASYLDQIMLFNLFGTSVILNTCYLDHIMLLIYLELL